MCILGVNYYLKLDNGERKKYSKHIAEIIGHQRRDVLPRVISACQDIFVEELKLDSNIAKNDALKVILCFAFSSVLTPNIYKLNNTGKCLDDGHHDRAENPPLYRGETRE